MPQYEQNTDSRKFEVDTSDPSSDVTDLIVRLWGPERSERRAPLSWNTDSVLVYMIADLVGASHGRIAEELSGALGAHFETSRQAIVAAKRIQTSTLEFLACRPGDRIGSAILLYRPSRNTADTGCFSAETAQQALKHSKPGQILIAPNISERLRDFPGAEIRATPALSTVMGGRQTELSEFVWTTPEKFALFQESSSDDSESPAGDVPQVAATVIVHSLLARPGRTSEAEPTAATSQPADNPLPRTPAFEALRESASGSPTLGLEELEAKPFLTRTRMILGIAALVLLGAVIAVLNRPVHVSKLPIPVPQEQAGTKEVPETRPAVKTEPEITPAQPESKTVVSENVKPRTVKTPIKPVAKLPVSTPQQTPDKAPVDNHARKDIQDAQAASYDESGGVSLKEIPTLLKMAQADAGAGNYDKARIEFRKILGLQPGNSDAKEGLHKLDLIQK
jgi:hypothetical protein